MLTNYSRQTLFIRNTNQEPFFLVQLALRPLSSARAIGCGPMCKVVGRSQDAPHAPHAPRGPTAV